MSEAEDDALILGIDFGTTFSGVAWAYSREPNEIETITSWETELVHCSDNEKTPSQISFNDDGEIVSWGYGVPADAEALKWFKFLLLDNKDVAPTRASSVQYKQSRDFQRKIKKDATAIIASFLRHLWNHAIDSIGKNIGVKLLAKCKFHVVITVPAIWPQYARQRMRKAAEASGMLSKRDGGPTSLHFISEPEAAALATIKDMSKKSTVEIGDTMVVCDAGGGTVDLITYIVESVKPFTVKEYVKGDGGLCGGMFLDEEFMRLIKTKVGSAAWTGLETSERKSFLNDSWEHSIKPQFSGQSRSWLVDLPFRCQALSASASGQRRKRRHALQLTSCELGSAFAPIAGQVKALVQRQVDTVRQKQLRGPDYVVLVGGFGRSPYLFKSLQSMSGHDTEVLQSRGSKPWTAICRGAVIHGITAQELSTGFAVKVESRIARFSYGVAFSTTWSKEKHIEEDKYWCDVRQEWRANNQMRWFLRQGEDITSKQAVRTSYVGFYQGPLPKLTSVIYTSAANPPSSRGISEATELCTMTCDTKLDRDSLPTWTNRLGKVFRKLDYDIEMTCEGGSIDFAAYRSGQRMGGRSVEVDFD